MKSGFDVFIPSSAVIFCDLIFSGLAETPKLGEEHYSDDFAFCMGGAAITLVGLSRLGVKVAYSAVLSEGIFGDWLAAGLSKEGVAGPEPLRKGDPAITVSFSTGSDRAFLSYSKVKPETERDLNLLKETRPRIFFATGLEGIIKQADLAIEAHKMGITIALDCQHTKRNATDPDASKILKCASILFANQVESRTLSGCADHIEGARKLLSFVPAVVLKLGEAGAYVFTRNEEFFRPSVKAEKVVDTTGAGDAFAAAFVYSMLLDRDYGECLECGHVAGASSVAAQGGICGLLTAEDLEQRRNLFYGKQAK